MFINSIGTTNQINNNKKSKSFGILHSEVTETKLLQAMQESNEALVKSGYMARHNLQLMVLAFCQGLEQLEIKTKGIATNIVASIVESGNEGLPGVKYIQVKIAKRAIIKEMLPNYPGDFFEKIEGNI